MKPKEFDEDTGELKNYNIISEEQKKTISINNTIQSIFDYSYSNNWTHFVTFTFNQEHCNRYYLKEVKKLMRTYIDHNWKRKNPNIQYLIVFEYHQDHAIHCHGLVNGLSDTEIQINSNGYNSLSHFLYGYSSVDSIKSVERIRTYITKYLTKSTEFPNEKGLSRYIASRNLNKPIITYDNTTYKAYNEMVKGSSYTNTYKDIENNTIITNFVKNC